MHVQIEDITVHLVDLSLVELHYKVVIVIIFVVLSLIFVHVSKQILTYLNMFSKVEIKRILLMDLLDQQLLTVLQMLLQIYSIMKLQWELELRQEQVLIMEKMEVQKE